MEDSSSPTSIDAILSEDRPSLSVTWDNSVSLSLENDALDQSIAELAGAQPGLTASDPTSITPWNAQRVLKGSAGDDQFIVEREPLKDQNHFAVTYVATAGSDRYEGSSGQDLAYYGELNNDTLSGLYISNEPEQLPLVSNNLPPLIAEDFEADDVLVYKNHQVTSNSAPAEIDRLRNIEAISLSRSDDFAYLSEREAPLIINFGEGSDQLALTSTGGKPEISTFKNLEKLNWNPLDSNSDAVSQDPIEFDVHEFEEDQINLIAVESYPPQETTNESIPWELSTFARPGTTAEPLPAWVELLELPPTPELVGEGRLVVDHTLITDEEDSTLLWLELSVHDKRPDGKGLIGLELNLDWNASALELVDELNTKDQVFNADHLPLFQDLGRRTSTEGREQIKGLGAAALPRGGQGLALGLGVKDGGQRRFARLAFRQQNAAADIDLRLTPTLTPPAGGVTLNSDELLVLDDRSPSVWVLRAKPDQAHVGSHAFTLNRGSGEQAEVRHLAVAVREVNDAPVAVEATAEDLELSVDQDVALTKNISNLFSDQDGADLSYSLVEAPSWIQLDATSGAITGRPGNAQVGEFNVTVQASDGRGGTALQTLRFIVQNVNDRPVLGPVALQPPELSQGESFTYRIPAGAFSDPDLLVDPSEQLTYSLEAAESGVEIPNWVQLDAETGTLSGTAGPTDVGESRFLVRATDQAGLYVEQAVVISVANVNDAPTRTSSLDAFLARQKPTAEGSAPPSEDDPFALFSGLNRSIDLKPWFTDQDLGIAENEQLNLAVSLDPGTGEIIDLAKGDEAPPWLQWDAERGVLTLAPSVEEIGQHFLRVRATDVEGLSASALVPLLVRHRNSAPFQQISSGVELINASVLNGVLAATPQTQGAQLTGVQFELAEDSAIEIELPASLFNDIDLSIDPAEKLTYSLNTSEDLPFSFDAERLRFTGDTAGLGLDQQGGRATWSAPLTVTDAAGETASFEIQMVLQRSAAPPSLEAVLNPDDAHWDEGSRVHVKDLLKLSLPPRFGEVVELVIERADQSPESLSLTNELDQDVAPRADGTWFLRGTTEEINAQLDKLTLHVPGNDHAIGTFALRTTATSELGNTGLRSEAVSTVIEFSLDPVATEPRWLQQTSKGADDALALSSFADYLAVETIDPREQLLYAIQLPETDQELLITDRAGELIGTREGNQVLLSKEQWASAMLRTDAATPEPVELQVVALSSEPSTGQQAASSAQSLSWQPTPLLTDEPQALLITPDGVQRSTDTTSVSVALAWPEVARSGQLQIDLPLGSAVTLEGVEAHTSEVDGKQRFVFTLQAGEAQPLPTQLDLKVSSPEIFRGSFEGSLELLSSIRSELPAGGLSAEDYATDQATALARRLTPLNFSWDVAQVAQQPEFGADSDLRFNPITGEIQIDLRRGSSSSGYRNPAEALTLSVRNIPAGYTLAERVNGTYRAVGATDAFGTMTLFTLPAAEADASPQAMGAFQRLNNNNLFLVSLDDDPAPLSSAQSLSLAVTARISDQPGGDSRSIAATRQLSLAAFSKGAPRLSRGEDVNPVIEVDTVSEVDPVILDLAGTGLPLTSLDQGASFAMLPEGKAIPTAWLRADANQGEQRTAAFLVMNDESNDSTSGDVQISSITELLSEFFQAEGRQRTFASGSAALASLNSNGDQRLDASDEAWGELQLWFDDGDAVSEAGELVALGEVLSSVDLGSLQTLSEQPSWAAGNAVLRRLSGVNLDDPPSDLALYDVGLQVAPAGSAPLPLSVTGPLALQENGDPAALKLTSTGSDLWQEGQDALTLVRLSGVPDELVPSLGVKDSRGDWLFTWADLNANGGQVEILTSPDWSGQANLQLLISQLQNDGSLQSSALTSLALDVQAVADTPVLQVNSTTIREDAPLALSSLLGRAETTDSDGSESLSFELHGLPNGAQIQRRSEGIITVLEPQDDGVYRIQRDDLDDLLFVPPGDVDGQLSFQWHAVATEQSNGSTAATVANVLINVRAVADVPLAPSQTETPPPLVEKKSVGLAELIQQPLATSGLTDNDGSEQLRLEFTLPSGLDLQSKTDPSWTPLSAQIKANGRQVVVVKASDFADLQLADLGVRQSGAAPANLQLAVTRISRESRTGDQARSTTLDFDLIFDREAQPPTLRLPGSPSALEDDGGIALTALLEAEPSQAGDQLTYKISGLANGLSLVDADGSVQVVPRDRPLTLASLEGWRLRTAEHNAGKYSVDLQVISSPTGQGAKAQTDMQRIEFEITPVADTPDLNFTSAPEGPLTIASNGWLNLGALGLKLSSSDQDGSERLSLVITAVDGTGEKQPLPSQAQFNVSTQQLDDGSLVVQQADLSGVSLYLGEIADDLALRLTARSRDGSSVLDGEPTLVTVKANAVVRVPLLEVRGVLEGLEDQPIPLLSQLEGVINAQLRGNGAGQMLELELRDLPQGSQLVRASTDPDNPELASFSPALNRNDEGELTPSLRLPYSQWSNVYWQGPDDQSGAFNFQVQAFSIGNDGKTLSSEINEVQALVTAVNDAPRLINLQDLDPINEGSTGTWNLRSRFLDVDNESTDLVISAKQVSDDGSIRELPAWLTLDADGVLSGTPSNSDVGVLKLELIAIDPLGQLTSQRITLAVGDVNASPVFNPVALQGWTTEELNGNTTYLRTLNLRENIQIDLTDAFRDEDLINNDQLSYSVSRDGATWSESITGVVEINNGTLTLKPEGKDNVGIQSIQLRATDLKGASNIQNLRLTVRNINDPPIVDRESAALLRAGVWLETVQLNQGEKNWQLNLEGLFKDADAGDRVDQIVPTDLPAWLTYTASTSDTGGVLSGTPGNGDVGVKTLQWQALDDAGSTATYRLRLDVQNVNDAPERRNNPNLSELGKIINGVPEVNQDAYGRLDLSELFLDPDSSYGDALRYSIAKISKEGTALETVPDWIGLTYRSTAAPDATDKFLLQPVLYRVNTNGTTGDQLGPGEINQLTAGTRLRVQVEASDNRSVERKGLITADLDIALSDAISLIDNTAEISENLPLFRSIESDTSNLLIKAGAIPDAGVGKPIGAQGVDSLISFDVQVQDPSQRVVIDLKPGTGDQRDGLIGRNLDTFDQSNSVIHSFASKIYLEALKPDNDSVGRYEIVIEATDFSGEKVSQILNLAIANLNDAPFIDEDGKAQTELLIQWLTEQRFEREREEKTFSVFSDPDLQFDDNLVYRLIPGSGGKETDNLALPNSVKVDQAEDGSLVLDLIPPSGITSVIEQQFKLLASDRLGLSTETDWFTVAFTPIAEETLLARGNQGKPLEGEQSGNASKKNAVVDLQSVLELNAITLSDPAGDEAGLKLLVQEPQAELSLADFNGSDASFMTKEISKEGTLFTINLNALTQASGNAPGSLEGLQLSVQDNQLQILPRALSPSISTGIPLQIWSETRVKGDSEGNFNVAVSDRSTLWVPIENTRPVYTQPALTKLDETFFASDNFNQATPLVELKNLFSDIDPSETLQWELETPKALKGLIELDNESGTIKLGSGINNIADLPAGSHRLLVRAKDSSGALGDASGIASGSIRVFVAAAEESPAIVRGLNLLTQIAADELNNLYAKEASERSESEQQVVRILDTLNVEKDERQLFMENLEKGSLAVLSNNDAEKPMVLIDASRKKGGLLMDAAIDKAEAKVIEASKQLLDSRDIVDTPLGEIEFSIDTQGRDFSIVQLQMEDGGVNMDTLFKTDADGNPLVFQSEIIRYSKEDGPLENWLATLSYGIYNYNMETDSTQEITRIGSSDSSIAASLLNADPLFNLDDFSSIDGSAFLIDLDQNNTIDLINMLLIDQGWFDTRPDVIGLIGDPLIPVSTVEAVATQGGGGGGGQSESTSNDSPTDGVDTNPEEDVNDDQSDPAEEATDNRPEASTDQGVAAANPQAGQIPVEETRGSNRRPGTERNEPQDSPGFNSTNKPPNTSSPANANQDTRAWPSTANANRNRQDENIMQAPNALNNAINSTLNRLLNNTQNWISTAQQQASDALRSIISPLSEPEDTSIAAALGMLTLPLLTERSTTRLFKAANKDLNLKLSRRDPLFNGCWITHNRRGKTILIERKDGKISIKSLDSESEVLPTLRSFNPEGKELLSQSLNLCKRPGAFIRSLQTLETQLTRTQATDINWNSWLDHHFKNDSVSRSSEKKSAAALDQLRSLIERASRYEPAFADVLMLQQLINCKEMLGLKTSLEERDSTEQGNAGNADAVGTRSTTPHKDSKDPMGG